MANAFMVIPSLVVVVRWRWTGGSGGGEAQHEHGDREHERRQRHREVLHVVLPEAEEAQAGVLGELDRFQDAADRLRGGP
jgi:hypothetical protein